MGVKKLVWNPGGASEIACAGIAENIGDPAGGVLGARICNSDFKCKVGSNYKKGR